MSFAVCLATCRYCGRTWRPVIETDAYGGFACELECPYCEGAREGAVRFVGGFEETEAAAIALAESWAEDEQ